jgi:hypothetical protein
MKEEKLKIFSRIMLLSQAAGIVMGFVGMKMKSLEI